MTVISAFGNHAYNLATIDAHDFIEGTSYVRTATSFRINYTGGDYDLFTGSGFSYALGVPVSGVVTSFSRFDNNALAFKISGATGLDGVEIAAVARTVATGDDQALLRTLLIGNDVLTGANLADVINGYAGSDEIKGGRGKDILTGGTGADDFNYHSVAESTVGAGRDRITDFQVGVDDIDVSVIDANGSAAGAAAFAFKGKAAFSGVAGQLHYFFQGTNTIVEGDTNGDKVADFQIELTGLKTLSSLDFIL